MQLTGLKYRVKQSSDWIPIMIHVLFKTSVKRNTKKAVTERERGEKYWQTYFLENNQKFGGKSVKSIRIRLWLIFAKY